MAVRIPKDGIRTTGSPTPLLTAVIMPHSAAASVFAACLRVLKLVTTMSRRLDFVGGLGETWLAVTPTYGGPPQHPAADGGKL
jgi:hypothetical protein